MTSKLTSPTGSQPRPRWLLPAAALAIVFGIASIIAGGRVLLGSSAARAAEADYVPFVLWFNFLAGFAYVGTGIVLVLARPWAARIAFAVAVGTGLVYAAFGIHMLIGGAFTGRTVVAMTVRTMVWVGIAALACRRFGCPRRKRAVGAMFVMTIVLVGVTTCGPPSNTVQMHAATTTSATPGRPFAPRMTVKDHKERELELPVQGRVTVLSFASRSTADRASERCREVRVTHPDVAIIELMNASSVPGFLAGKVKGKLADRHEAILADSTQAFAAAHKSSPADLNDRIHIVADWTGAAFKAYGATNTDAEVQLAVIDSEGRIVSFFTATPSAADVAAAIVRASSPGGQQLRVNAAPHHAGER
jgi:hypothetical protein